MFGVNGKLRWAALLNVAIVCRLLSQTSSVPYDPIHGGPTFTSKQTNYVHKGSYTSVRAVDFRNFTFRFGGQEGQFSLKNGSYKHDETYGHSRITLDSIYYLSGAGASGTQSALVLLSWFAAGGSSSQAYTALVFKVYSNRLQATQVMQWDTHFQTKEPKESFDPGTDTLLVRTAHYIPGDAHCCVSAMDVITLRWDGRRFGQKDFKTELSDYGKAKGKTLP